MRKGFGLLTAIIILVTVSFLMLAMTKLTTSSVKTTSDVYLKAQAELLLKSATEYALLAISGHENNQSCVQNINIAYPNKVRPTHEMNMTLYYIYAGLAPAGCPNNRILAQNIDTNESNLTVVIDTIVSVDKNNTGITEDIVLTRRTIQKP